MGRFDEDVQKVQIMLKALEYEPGPLDGIQGRRTTEALWAFQDDYDMDTYDEIDDDMIYAINDAFHNESIKYYWDVVQLLLWYAEYDPGTIDGVFGPNTSDAIYAFQEDNDLDATGEIDHETMTLLRSVLYGMPEGC